MKKKILWAALFALFTAISVGFARAARRMDTPSADLANLIADLRAAREGRPSGTPAQVTTPTEKAVMKRLGQHPCYQPVMTNELAKIWEGGDPAKDSEVGDESAFDLIGALEAHLQTECPHHPRPEGITGHQPSQGPGTKPEASASASGATEDASLAGSADNTSE